MSRTPRHWTIYSRLLTSHVELAISSVIEPLMKRAKVHHARVELTQSSRPKGADQGTLTPAAARQKRSCKSDQKYDRRPPKTTERYTKQGPSSEARTNEQYKRTIRCYACEGNHTIWDCPEFNWYRRQRASSYQGEYNQPSPSPSNMLRSPPPNMLRSSPAHSGLRRGC